MKKRRVIFRVFEFNRLTFPTLLNVWEREGLDARFEIIIAENPIPLMKDDILLYSFMTPHLPLIGKEIRQLDRKDILIAAGGPHINGSTELPSRMGFHVLFQGTGEETFKQFGFDLLEDRVPEEGKVYREDGLPDTDKYFPFSKYFRTVPPLEIFRGCIWRCKYCQTGTAPHAFRSMDSIRSFLERLRQNQFQRVTFISPSAFEYGARRPGKPDVEKIGQLIETVAEFGFKFFEYGIFPSEIRPGTLDPALTKLLRKHVVNNSITLGAQSGSDIRLRELNRGHTTADVERDIATANSSGFRANLDFILGYPDETRDEREETFRFIEKLNREYRVKVHMHHFFPLSGSSYQYRFPSPLEEKDEARINQLKNGGIATNWWESHRKTAESYFAWLRHNFPDYYDRYSL